MPDYMG